MASAASGLRELVTVHAEISLHKAKANPMNEAFKESRKKVAAVNNGASWMLLVLG